MASGNLLDEVRGSARGSLILMAGQAASNIVEAIGFILIARFLGAISFGVVSVAYMPISLAITMLDIGVSSAMIKYISQYRADDKPSYRRIIMETGLLINLGVALFLTLIVYFSSGFVSEILLKQPEIAPLIRIYSLLLIGQTLLNTVFAILIGYERMTPRSIVKVLFSLLRSIAGPILVYLGLGPMGAILGEVGAALISGLIGVTIILTIWRHEPRQDQAPSHLECGKLILGYGYPLFFSNLLMGLTPNLNRFILALFVDSEQIGNYQAATRFGVLITFFTMSVATALFPLFSKLENEEEALKMVFTNSIKFIGLIVFPIIAAVISLAPQIIFILYAEGYEYAVGYLRIFMFSYIVLGFGGVGVVAFLNAIKQNKVVFIKSFLNSILTLSLGLVLIPRLGVEGLLISTVIGPVIGVVYSLRWVKKERGFTIDYGAAIKSLLAAFIAYVATSLYTQLVTLNPLTTLISGGIICIATYLISILVLRVLNSNDLEMLINLTSGLGPLSPVAKRLLLNVKKVSA